MASPRLLLVEDDAAIRRFVLMALEDLAVEVHPVATLAEADAALAAGPWDLLLTDLMLPDGNGTELLARLATRPDAPVRAVFSAGVNAELRERLRGLGVRRIVDKPSTLATLLDAVADCLAQPRGMAAPPAGPLPDAADAVATHFGGDATLYAAYRAATIEQFSADLVEGDRCVAAGDLPALRRVGHSLKTVLGLLGDAAGAEAARALEKAAHAGAPDAAARWVPVRERLVAWRGEAAAG